MKNTTLWVVIALVVLAALGWWGYSTQTTSPAVPAQNGDVAGDENQFVDDSKDGASDPEGIKNVTVNHSPGGFSPKTLTVRAGTRVTFVHQGTGPMWVASDEHPVHSQYSGTERASHCPDPGGIAFDQCSSGTTYSFVFNKAGSWGYHNHMSPEDKGTIVVTP